MALESVFGTPPPVVGAVDHKDHTMKHGEKQSDDSMAEADPEKEEGEIEDGEIIDSGEEEGVAANNGPTVAHFNRMVAGLHPDLENEIEAMGSLKRKKKKKKRRKRMPSGADGENGGGLSGSEDAAPPKSKKHKSHYVDHDRISDSDGVWFGGSQAYSQRRQERGGECFDSTPRASSPPNQAAAMPPTSKRSPSRSPPGLYDSPPESSGDEFNGPSGAERGGSGMYGNFSNSNYDGLGSDYLRRKKGNKSGKMGKRRKGDKRSKGGRSKQNKRKESRRQICKFYLDGKCHKGDECGYSHDQPQTRKMELCKFYLNGFCHKGDSCIYMHKDFPCKFFHTGAKCYSADNCKFSHDELTDEMRWVLEKYLDKEDDAGNSDSSLPKHPRPSLLGSPPRHIKEMAAQEALRKIPSLFDIEVEPPPTITPPTGQPQPSRPNFYSDTMSPPNHNRPPLLPFPTSTFDPDPADFPFDEDIRPPFGGPMGGPGGPCNEPCFGNGPSGRNMPPPPPYCGEPPMMEPSMQDIDERFPPMMDNQRRFQSGSDFDDDRPNMMNRQRGPRHTNDMQQPFTPSWRNSDVDMRTRPHLEMDKDVENLVSNEWDDETTGDKDKGQSSESENDKRSDFASSNMGSGGGGGGGIPIPLHLPKKQRELFLRIQQQQRQADSSQEDSDKGEWKKVEAEVINTELIVTSKWDEEVEDEEEKAVKKAEKESWYSSDDDSDDEDQPLTAVLKKLQQEPLQKQTQQPSLFNITQMLQSITGVKPPTAAISAMESPVNRLELGRDPRSQKPSDTRDPRSNRNVDLRDPRARTLRDPRSMANATPPETPLTLRDPRLHFSSSDSNSLDDSKFPSMKEKLKTESWSDVEADTGLSLKTAFHPIPYRLRAMAVSQSVYTNLAQSMQMDPKMFSSDPRLRRQLMNDPRLRRSAALLGAVVGMKKDNKDGLIESKGNAENTKDVAKKDILLPRFAQQRLSDDKESSVDATAADTKKDVSVLQFGRRSLMEEKDQDLDTKKDVPLPQFGRRSSLEDDAKEMLLPSFGHHRFTSGSKDVPVVTANNNGKATPSPERKPDDHQIQFEEALGSSSDDDDDDSSDDLVIIESVFKDEPDEPVILDAKISKGSNPSTSGDEGATDEPVIVLESGSPPKIPKVNLTYMRKCSMDYASPLGYANVEPSETSGYDRKPSPKKWPTPARSPGSTEGKASKAQPMSSIPPSPQPLPSIEETASRSPPSGNGANSKSLSTDDIDGMAAVEGNTSLKDIFKTIDPTASPFC